MAKHGGRNTDTEVPNALTVSELVRRAGCQFHQVRYFIDSRGIVPIMRVGGYRIFSDDTLEQLKDHLADLKKRKRAV